MDPFNADAFVRILALVGGIIVVAALLSGLVERTALPQVFVFIGLGAVLGPSGLALLNVELDSGPLRVVATLSLALVLFSDAITIDLVELRRNGLVSLLVVGPGTLLTAALIGLAGWGLLGLVPAAAAILGAALASTDPVLLKSVLRARGLPNVARQALRIESGVNDAVLLPIVLVGMAFLSQSTGASHDWARFAIDLVILGPASGIAVGLVSVATLDLIRRRIGVTRDYESLYAIGTALAAYAAAEALHGSGFLAAFAAGATIAALDVELCDCFIEYGQTTAEMALLFTFVLLGGSLIWNGLSLLNGPIILFAIAAVLLRPLVYVISLAPARLEPKARVAIAWFGPRGLSSLLLVLLAVFAGIPGADYLFALCSVVVLLSLVVHGGTPAVIAWVGRARDRADAAPSAGSIPAITGATVPLDVPSGRPPSLESPTPDDGARDGEAVADKDRISIAELRRLWEVGEHVFILDVRTERSYNREPLQAAGSIRLQPDHVAERAAELDLPRDSWIVAYCT
jgi:NhaP-type Na+/H+ or K+/H+ antiporter